MDIRVEAGISFPGTPEVGMRGLKSLRRRSEYNALCLHTLSPVPRADHSDESPSPAIAWVPGDQGAPRVPGARVPAPFLTNKK